MRKRFVSVGEPLIELSGGEGGLYRLGFAGDTLNTAWYARALLPSDWDVDYVTALGDDLYSQQMLDFIKDHGIGTRHIQRIPRLRAGLYLIHQEGGDRHFTYWRGQSAARHMTEDEAAFAAGFSEADFVYFSGISLAILPPEARERLLDRISAARRAGARIAFDSNIRPALWTSQDEMRDVLTDGASRADLVLPTHVDEKQLFGDRSPEETADRYLSLGAQEVVVKDGSNPALIATVEARSWVAGRKVADVVDATGAGDSFNSAYISARLSGKSLEESALMAHAVAAVVIGCHGALVAPDHVFPTD